MFDREGFESYLRQKISLENKLAEIGDFRGSKEIEMQASLTDERLLARIKQAHYHAIQEVNGLKIVLIESSKEE